MTDTTDAPPRTRRRRWLFPLIALGLGGAMSLGICEIGLRLIDPRGISDQVHNAGFLLFGLEPGGHPLVYRQGIADAEVLGYRLNNIGFRGPDVRIEKAPGVRRIVVVGDSLAFGSGCPFEDLWTTVLERQLRADGERVEVVNISVPGYNAVGELGLLVHRALPLRPDLVVLLAVQNDDVIQPGNQAMYALFPSLADGEIDRAARPQTFPRDTWLYPVWKLANRVVPYTANFAYIYVLGQASIARSDPDGASTGGSDAPGSAPGSAPPLPLTLADGGRVGMLDMYHAQRTFHACCQHAGVPVLALYLGAEGATDHARYTAAAAASAEVPVRYLPKTYALGAEYRNGPSDGHYNGKGNRALASEVLEVAGPILRGTRGK